MAWSAEADATLLSLLERYKPCGAQRPWALASVRCALRAALPSADFAAEEVGRRVNHYFNFDCPAMEDVRTALERPLRTSAGFKLPRRIWQAYAGTEAPAEKKDLPDPESAASETVSGDNAAREASPAPEETDDRKRKRRSPSPVSNKRAAPTKHETEGVRRRQQRAEEIYRSVKVPILLSSMREHSLLTLLPIALALAVSFDLEMRRFRFLRHRSCDVSSTPRHHR